jgi:hypothetical protein
MEAGPRDTSWQSSHGGAEPLDPDRPDDPHAALDRGVPTGEPGAGTVDDGPDSPAYAASSSDVEAPSAAGESFRDLRPPRRMRMWQLVPIVGVAIVGSLMFAFPLAFEFGDSGMVVAMLGLLLGCCAAGLGLMAARRVGLVWPGLPPRGSGRRTDWRYVLLYVGVVLVLVLLALWRVARLR